MSLKFKTIFVFLKRKVNKLSLLAFYNLFYFCCHASTVIKPSDMNT